MGNVKMEDCEKYPFSRIYLVDGIKNLFWSVMNKHNSWTLVVVVVMVAVAFSPTLAGILGECLTSHSLPALFFCFFRHGDYHAHTISTL